MSINSSTQLQSSGTLPHQVTHKYLIKQWNTSTTVVYIYCLHNNHLISTCTETMLWYKLNHLGHSSTHICEIWKSICPQKVKHQWWAILTILLKQGGITVPISEPGPFPILGHSSGTKQSATWREWICPRESLSGPFPKEMTVLHQPPITDHSSKLLTTVNFERMTARRGGPFYLTTTQSDCQEEWLS